MLVTVVRSMVGPQLEMTKPGESAARSTVTQSLRIMYTIRKDSADNTSTILYTVSRTEAALSPWCLDSVGAEAGLMHPVGGILEWNPRFNKFVSCLVLGLAVSVHGVAVLLHPGCVLESQYQRQNPDVVTCHGKVRSKK